jgi:hypothetical protein
MERKPTSKIRHIGSVKQSGTLTWEEVEAIDYEAFTKQGMSGKLIRRTRPISDEIEITFLRRRNEAEEK